MSLACDARLWLRAHRYGLLSTHSRAVAGYPFGSVVLYVLDHDACPVLLISRLAEHTKKPPRYNPQGTGVDLILSSVRWVCLLAYFGKKFNSGPLGAALFLPVVAGRPLRLMVKTPERIKQGRWCGV